MTATSLGQNEATAAESSSLGQNEATAAESSQQTLKPFLGIEPWHIGETYDEEQVLGMLTLENEVLRETLFHEWAKRDALTDEADPMDVYEGLIASDDSFAGYDPSELAQKYLATQTRVSGARRHLVIANAYPRIGREYNNGFVHRRVKRYINNGNDVDVAVIGFSDFPEIFTFDGVNVLSGRGPELPELLKRENYDSVSVHFMNQRMWRFIEPSLNKIKLHVFMHGYETDRWIRRIFNIVRPIALERALDRTFELQYFWRKVVARADDIQSFVFVSNWKRRVTEDDIGIIFPYAKTRIIHNVVDEELFVFAEKDAEQRFKILWIRPASSMNYAHDIAIDVIKQLSKTAHWPKIQVKIIGDGQYFGDFERELGEFSNVSIERRFLQQSEIADYHKQYGLFLVPSRLDSQGVSRDEAMASGLVPITNEVAAIPEFVNKDCAVLAPVDEPEQLVLQVVELMDKPELFLQKSAAASARARRQTCADETVDKELTLLGLSRREDR